MPITPLPTAPSRGDTPANFVAKADAFLAALATLVTEMNAVVGVANIKGVWVSGTTYAAGDVVWSPINHQNYRRKTGGAGTTDPSADATNWQPPEVVGSTLVAQGFTAYTTGGTAPAYTLTPSPALSAYAAGQRFRVNFAAGGTTGSNTLNVSGLGAKNLKQYDSSGAKVAAVVAASQLADVEYDGTDMVVLNPLLSLPAGTVVHVAQNTAPTGFLKANGAAVSRTTYAALFAAIGTTFGTGDGSTTFNVPDLRGEFVRGWDDARGVDSGRAFGSTQADELKSHSHTSMRFVGGTGTGLTSSSSAVNDSGTTSATGGTETRPRNLALLACIKY